MHFYEGIILELYIFMRELFRETQGLRTELRQTPERNCAKLPNETQGLVPVSKIEANTDCTDLHGLFI